MIKTEPLWRRAPPAIFPICLGLLGLGLGWRNGAGVLPIIPEIGDVLLGIGAAFYLYFLAFYLLKLMARPLVLVEDMANPAARAGVAAMAMSMMLLADALRPLGGAAPYIWWLGVVMQIGASAIGVYAIWSDPPERREFTTFQYLTFVGPVVGPFAGIPLGYVWESIALTLGALVAYFVITGGLIVRLTRNRLPVGMRPSLAIFLAPNCLFAISFGLLGWDWAFHVFFWLAGGVALALVLGFPWLVKGGWSPVWAAFTFPAAAFIGVQVMGISKGIGLAAEIGFYASVTIGTPLILYVAYRSVLIWATGELAERTGAARA